MDVKPQTEPAALSMSSNAERPMDQEVNQAAGSTGQSDQKADSLAGFGWFVVKLVAAVFILRIFVIAPFSIPSESMLPGLWQGDYLVATKWSYGYSRHSLPFETSLPDGRIFASEPERGDIVIFKHPVDSQDYVKRVIGLPGDTVQMIGGQIAINGVLIAKEPIVDFRIAIAPNASCTFGDRVAAGDDGRAQCAYRQFREKLPGGQSIRVLDFGLSPGDGTSIATVPEGHMFVMGDNRDYSRDSRFPALAGDAVGMVPQDNLVARARFVFWSSDGTAQWLRPWTWLSAARWERMGHSL
jgi:signal peptidase I